MIGFEEFDRAFLLYQELNANYSICPFCDGKVDLSDIDLFEKGKYLYCPCFENSTDWQYRTQTRGSLGPLHVLSTYTYASVKQVISLTIVLEDVGYTHQVWRAFLNVDPTAMANDNEPLITLEALWPPEKEAADLLMLLNRHQKFLDETMSRLRADTYCVNSSDVQTIENLIGTLENQLKNLKRK